MTRFRSPRRWPGPDFPQALAKMKAGSPLRLTFLPNNKSLWEIDGLGRVDPAVVALLTNCKEIEPSDDALFAGAPAQTWRLRSVK